MIIWLTMKAFESLYNTPITGEGLYMTQAFGFMELLVEITAILVGIIAFVSTKLEKS